jgi:hypothetical protein
MRLIRGVSTNCGLSKLRRNGVGWLSYFWINQAYREMPGMDQWLRLRGVCHDTKQLNGPSRNSEYTHTFIDDLCACLLSF